MRQWDAGRIRGPDARDAPEPEQLGREAAGTIVGIGVEVTDDPRPGQFAGTTVPTGTGHASHFMVPMIPAATTPGVRPA